MWRKTDKQVLPEHWQKESFNVRLVQEPGNRYSCFDREQSHAILGELRGGSWLEERAELVRREASVPEQ